MYFDISPKTKKSDLFGVDYQLEQLKKYLLDKSVRMVAIKGLKRTGKTSLLNVALNEVSIKNVKIDVREAPFYDKKEFAVFLSKQIREKMGSVLDKIIKSIAGIKFRYDKFSFELLFSKEENITLFFARLNSYLNKANQMLILAFDEAQLLKGIGFDYFLASIFDNYKNIKIVLTGSEIGVLDKLLGKADYDAPLFGRAYLEIDLKKMGTEEIRKFLEEGFKQIGKKIEFEEVEEVVENLDGTMGWITYYGWFRYKRFSHGRALERAKEEGKAIVKRELENFLQGRKAKPKYLKIIKYLARGHHSWSSLKQAFIKDGLKIADSQLNSYLKELINFGFVEKSAEKYFVTDPLLE
jgi:AAA+ ATPase superfamily predicted ATPase